MIAIEPLRADEIEVKVKQVTAKGVFALLYKTARTDMARLDDAFGPENWACDYKEVKGNLYCGIGVRHGQGAEWVWRWDCGIESREDDGNEKKGEASDAFKRAGTRWGIGRELYTAPRIFIRVETTGSEKGGRTYYSLKDPFVSFDVKSIEYDEKRHISALEIVDNKGVTVYSWRAGKTVQARKSADGKKPEPQEKKPPTLDDALETAFEFGGKEYRLKDLSEEWLRNNKGKERFAAIRKEMEIVLKYKMLEGMKEKEDVPFPQE